MLDDANYVAQFDRSNALAIVAGQAGQLRQQYDFDPPIVKDLRNVVVAGMGGSALAAEFIRSWLSDKLPIPVVIVRDYKLPAFVGPQSLVVVSSYSGNTEETLACLAQAEDRKATIVVATSGGELDNQKGDHPYLQIPGGLQPRMALLYEVKALASLFEKLEFATGITKELEANADWLLNEAAYFALSVRKKDNPAKQIAERLIGHPIVVYAGPTLAFGALKWKIGLNENAKNQAFYYLLPEFNHNEFIGWQYPKDSLLRVVELHSSLDGPHIKKRFEVSNRLLSGIMPAPIVVEARGETKLQQLLWAVMLGDFVSVYLAFLNKVDPTPVVLIEKLKKEL